MSQLIEVKDPYTMKRQWEALDMSKFTDHYGLEMEVYRDAGEDYDCFDCDTSKDTLDITIDKAYPVYAVYDYSLNDEDVEYVTSPMPKEMLLKGEWLSKTVHKLHSKRYGFKRGVQPDEYGLHINVNTSHMTKQEIVLLQFVLNVSLLSRGTDHIRGRCTPYRDSTLKSKKKGRLGRSYEDFHQNPLSKASPRRGDALACRRSMGNRLEVRGFQMDSSVRTIRKQINFIERAKTFVSLYPDYVAKLYVETVNDAKQRQDASRLAYYREDYTQTSKAVTTKLDRMTNKLLNTTINKRQEFKLSEEATTLVTPFINF